LLLPSFDTVLLFWDSLFPAHNMLLHFMLIMSFFLPDAARFGHVDVVQALLKAGAEPSIQNLDGKTAADLAAAHGKAQVVALILDDNKHGHSS
jgi:Ankyrin repeats (many copies)